MNDTIDSCKCGAKISYDLIRDGVDNGTDLQ